MESVYKDQKGQRKKSIIGGGGSGSNGIIESLLVSPHIETQDSKESHWGIPSRVIKFSCFQIVITQQSTIVVTSLQLSK